MDNHGGQEENGVGKTNTKMKVRRSRSFGRENWHGLLAQMVGFLRRSWLDWVTLVATGVLMAGLWTIQPTRVRYFPITFSGSGDIVYPSLAYPYVESIFSAAAAGVMSALIPIVVILVCQIPPPGMRMRLGMGTYSRFEDASSAILGLAYSLVTGTCFQVILKKSVGGYRPHFLSVCEPVIPPTNDGGSAGRGFQSVMYLPTDVCTGDPHRIRIAQESFPSGHTQIAFAGYIYLAIYLNAHLRVFSTSASATATANTTTTTPPARRPGHWKMLAIFAPVLLATYLSSTLVLGHHHHWYDVCFGALIGIVMAVWAYKMVFVSLWDGRTNCESLFREDGKAKRKEKDDDVVSGQPNGSGSANASAGGAVLPMTRQDVNAANASGHM